MDGGRETKSCCTTNGKGVRGWCRVQQGRNLLSRRLRHTGRATWHENVVSDHKDQDVKEKKAQGQVKAGHRDTEASSRL